MLVTKLSCLVKYMKIKSPQGIYLFSLPIKESEIINFFLGTSLKDEVLKIMPVQKHISTRQLTRFKMLVPIRDYNGHAGQGVKCSKEVATATQGAIILAKLSLSPCRDATGGINLAALHIPCKVTDHCGSVLIHLIPAPKAANHYLRGTDIDSAPVPRKLLQMAGVNDCDTSVRGCIATLGNFTKATLDTISKTSY
ncbi:40S ribosomal protein S2-like [Otolemur garnettii]|uniref:40S ribosomal protein S2-like n=1 Tax=Otolemur garnettii TaxID=30611 RepID=UPI000643EC11|nr:40S ribosomal protein S2-like [Otolemur garnettii]